MLVPYVPSDSKGSVQSFFQQGSGIPVYSGRSIMRGGGVGSFLGGLFKSAAPLLKRGALNVGKRLFNTGMGIARDVMQGEKFGVSAKKRIKAESDDLLADVSRALAPDFTKTESVVKKKPQTKTRRKKKGKRDIFQP